MFLQAAATTTLAVAVACMLVPARMARAVAGARLAEAPVAVACPASGTRRGCPSRRRYPTRVSVLRVAPAAGARPASGTRRRCPSYWRHPWRVCIPLVALVTSVRPTGGTLGGCLSSWRPRWWGLAELAAPLAGAISGANLAVT